MSYFGEEFTEPDCGNCDNCKHPKEKVEAKENVRDGKNKAWEKFLAPIKLQVTRTVDLIQSLVGALPAKADTLQSIAN